MQARQLLVGTEDLHGVYGVVGRPPSNEPAAAGAALTHLELTPEQAAAWEGRPPGSTSTLAAMHDRPMGPGLQQAPQPVGWVHGTSMDYHRPLLQGTSMDYHGHGAPIEAARALSRREPGARGGLGEGALVGVVDTGMRAHPWLNGGYLASPDDFEPFDAPRHGATATPHLAGHGTFITGLILQQAPGAGVWVERALDPGGQGLASSVAAAALTLARRGVHVLNLSLGCFDDDPGAELVMQRMVQGLREVNPSLVIVAAAGNIGSEQQQAPASFWPAALPGVLAVGAVDHSPKNGSYTWSPWSNRGDWVNLAVPATDLLSTYVYGSAGDPADGTAADFAGWATWSGTSMAAAVVTGAIAAAMPGVTAAEAAQRLQADRSRPAVQPDRYAPSVRVVEPAYWEQLTRKYHGR